QPAKRRNYLRRLLFRSLLFLRFLGRFCLLRLWSLVRLGDYGAVDRIDVHFLDSGLARDGDVKGVNQLSVLALELAGLHGAVRNFLERCRLRGILRNLGFLLERSLALFLLHSLVLLGRRRGRRRRLGGALVVGARALRPSYGGGSGESNCHGYPFEHASSSICLICAPATVAGSAR